MGPRTWNTEETSAARLNLEKTKRKKIGQDIDKILR